MEQSLSLYKRDHLNERGMSCAGSSAGTNSAGVDVNTSPEAITEAQNTAKSSTTAASDLVGRFGSTSAADPSASEALNLAQVSFACTVASTLSEGTGHLSPAHHT